MKDIVYGGVDIDRLRILIFIVGGYTLSCRNCFKNACDLIFEALRGPYYCCPW